MSAKNDLTIPLLPDRYYHIFYRGINRCDIYFNQKNYKYFLKKYGEKMTGYFDIFGYCLLQNHFHMFIRVVHQDQLLVKAVDDFHFVNQTFYKDYVMPWVCRMKLEVVVKEVDLTNFRNLLNLYPGNEKYKISIIGHNIFGQNFLASNRVDVFSSSVTNQQIFPSYFYASFTYVY